MHPFSCDFSEKFHFQQGNVDSRSEEQDFKYFSRLRLFLIKQQQTQIFHLSNQQIICQIKKTQQKHNEK